MIRKLIYLRAGSLRPETWQRIDDLVEATGMPRTTIVDVLLIRGLGIEDQTLRGEVVLRALAELDDGGRS